MPNKDIPGFEQFAFTSGGASKTVYSKGKGPGSSIACARYSATGWKRISSDTLTMRDGRDRAADLLLCSNASHRGLAPSGDEVRDMVEHIMRLHESDDAGAAEP